MKVNFTAIKGDLIADAKKGTYDIIAHGCNCMCIMGSGIALSVKEEFPEAFDADCSVPPSYNKMGTLTYAEHALSGFNGKKLVIANLYQQAQPGKGSLDYDALRLALRKLIVLAHQIRKKKNLNEINIGIPLIACGLAGGNWSIVYSILKQEFGDHTELRLHYYEEYVPEKKELETKTT